MNEAQSTLGRGVDGTPVEVVRFHQTIPVFQMLEFSMFPDVRVRPEDWQSRQEGWLSAHPHSTSLRVLTELPDGEMLSFDLHGRDEGFPLGIFPVGFPEDAEPLDLTMFEYVDLAIELAPLEAQMLDGVFPYEEIVAAIERRGLRENEFWAECLELMAEQRDGTEERMRYVRENKPNEE